MDRTSHRLATRLAASVAVGLLTVGLASAPATALRLVPVDPPTAVSAGEPIEDPSLLLTMGRVSTHIGERAGIDADPAGGTGAELFMSSGRLPR